MSGAVAMPDRGSRWFRRRLLLRQDHAPTKATHGQSDYQRDLDRIKAAIAETGPEALAAPVDTPRAVKYAYSLYQQAVLTGDLTTTSGGGAGY